MPRKSNLEVASFIISNIEDHPQDIVSFTAEHFNISRQSAHRYVKKLLDSGELMSQGTKRNIKYELPMRAEFLQVYKLTEKLDEGDVWTTNISHLLQWLPKNVLDICNYGFTEMLNNAIDHSSGTTVDVFMCATAASVNFSIHDNGVGIFRKIKEKYDLGDERQSLLELSKGKTTTDPTKHSGEGIFFTSRMFDTFRLAAGNIVLYTRNNSDWLFDDGDTVIGTKVFMQISTSSSRTLTGIFDQFTTDLDEYGFTRTRVPVTLAQVGEDNLISRSQAKRLLARVDRFREVLLDFNGVTMIGQAFADEIFRVFANEHPNVQLIPINADPAVARMISRVLSRNAEL